MSTMTLTGRRVLKVSTRSVSRRSMKPSTSSRAAFSVKPTMRRRTLSSMTGRNASSFRPTNSGAMMARFWVCSSPSMAVSEGPKTALWDCSKMVLESTSWSRNPATTSS